MRQWTPARWACQDRAMPSEGGSRRKAQSDSHRAESGWRRHVLPCAVLFAVAVLRWHGALLDPRLAVDESDYTGAFARVAAGEDPYAIPRFLYPPPFALAGAAAERALDTPAGVGERRVVVALRAANVLGAVAIVWISLGWSALAWRPRLAIGCLLLVAWAPIHQSIASGNISLAILGLTLAAVALLPQRAVAAGALLGAGLALKPLAPAIVALLPAWRPAATAEPSRRSARAGWITAATAAVALAAALLCGRELLPRMLAKTTGHLAPGHTVSLWRLLYCLGIDTTPLLLLVLAVAVCAPLLWLRRRTTAELAVLTGTAAIYASPLVWTHTLALTLPGQVLALERAARSWRAAPAASPERSRALLALCVLAALALTIQGSEALVAINNRPLLVQAFYLAPPVLAPAIFAWIALRRGAFLPVPSGIGPTVGQ